MPNELKPIDRAKRSNRRCANCAEYESCNKMPASGPITAERYCKKAEKHINYWNSCAHFSWNPDKTYKN